MSQIILSINAGSSSLKCSLYKATPAEKKLEKLAGGEVSAIGTEKAHFKYTRAQEKQETDLDTVQDHKQAFEHVLDAFLNDKSVAVTEKGDIKYACHRVVRKSPVSAPTNPRHNFSAFIFPVVYSLAYPHSH